MGMRGDGGGYEPCSDVDLFSQADRVRFEERIHILPAIQLSDSSDLCIDDHARRIPRSVPEDQALDVSSSDLAAMVDYIPSRINQNLTGIQRVQINLRIPQRNKNAILLRGTPDAVHFGGVRGEGVLAVFLEKGEGFLVGYAPHPVGVAWDPFYEDRRVRMVLRMGVGKGEELTELRESDEFASCFSSFIDPVDGLLDGGLQVQPAWFGVDRCGFVIFDCGGHCGRVDEIERFYEFG